MRQAHSLDVGMMMLIDFIDLDARMAYMVSRIQGKRISVDFELIALPTHPF